jgi:hypothetical protein
MSQSYSLCLLLKQDNLIEGLSRLAMYEHRGGRHDGYAHSLHDPHFLFVNTAISDIIKNIPTFVSLISTPEPDDVLTDEEIAKCDLKNGEQSITLWFTPWMQNIFGITTSGKYMIINVNYAHSRNIHFIPPDHPSLSLIQEVITVFQPIFGWIESDFIGSPSFYFDSFSNTNSQAKSSKTPPHPTEKAPWHTFSYTTILGEPLLFHIEQVQPLNSFGFSELKRLSSNLVWQTSPGTFRASYGNLDESDFSPNLTASENLFKILKTIPTSILN